MKKKINKIENKSASSGNRKRLLGAALIVTFLAFLPSLQNGFVNLDDPQYLTENPVIKKLNPESLKMIFTEQFVGNYQPLTMLSYMVEHKIFGMKPFGYHFMNLFFHLMSTLLVFFIFEKISRNNLISFITAVLFGIHPLHVESIAWISERKDVLYGFYFLWSLFFYIKHIQQEKPFSKYFVFSLILFVCSVLSKAQAVILPIVFFVFDYLLKRKFSMKTLTEKIPFLFLAVIFGLIAIKVQGKAGAMQDFEYFPIGTRALFVCYALVNYFRLIILPYNLSCFYPYPETNDAINSNWVYAAPIILITISFFIWKFFHKERAVVFGFGFFMFTIALVLQIIPLGDALYADRYTYIPSLGLFFIAAFYFQKIYFEKKNLQSNLRIGGIVILVLLAVGTFVRCGVWKDSITLYTDAIKKQPTVPILYNNRGAAFADRNDYQSALADFSKVVQLKSRYPNGFRNLAISYERLGDSKNALTNWDSTVKYFPDDINNYISRGNVLKQLNDFERAINDYSKIIEMNPAMTDAYYARAEAYGKAGKNKEALADLNKVISIKPNYAEAYSNRGIVNGYLGKNEDAITDFSKAVELNPNLANVYSNRSVAYKAIRNFKAAYEDALKAKQLGFAMDEKYLEELRILSSK